MALLQLLNFQQDTANNLIENALNYYQNPDKIGGRIVPYVGQLKAVTGAGKTPILANVISKLKHSIVLWTTKFGSVVDQTVNNLAVGGKYNHLLGAGVDVVKFSDMKSAAEWDRVIEQDNGLTILVSTVAAWNSSEKDPRLNVHRGGTDWGEPPRWERLKSERKRPLWVVYDEAHNTTTEQIELLDDLEPAGFFVASASPLGGKLQMYLTSLPEDVRKKRFASIRTRDVADAELLKSTISLADYQSGTEEMISDVVKRLNGLTQEFADAGFSIIPKAIYVVEKSNTAKGMEARPIAIWKTLVNTCGVSPSAIAVCTDTKELPKEALKVSAIDQLSDQFTHIIFNKKLQEGWDDPTVYCCYFDGSTESATRIQQVIGRALRQPSANHFDSEDLNTAYFFINCPNEALEIITDELKEALRIYKSGDGPDDFEPFKIKEERKAIPAIALKPQLIGTLKVPELQPELPEDDPLRKLVEKETFGFDDEERAAPGKAMVNIVAVRTGDVTHNTRDLLEDMRIRCGSYLQEQIRAQSKNCANAIPVNVFTTPELNKTACFKSKALDCYKPLANRFAQEYARRVRLEHLVDPDVDQYVVGSFYPTGNIPKPFDHAGHAFYDSKSFNPDELAFAKALDKFDHVWVRNKDRIGYGIPLPIKSGSSSNFYPDFLWWVNDTVWALDPTGKFILDEKIRTKLLTVPAPLRLALITKNKLSSQYQKIEDGGWTLMRFRVGNAAPEPFDSLDDLLKQLISET